MNYKGQTISMLKSPHSHRMRSPEENKRFTTFSC